MNRFLKKAFCLLLVVCMALGVCVAAACASKTDETPKTVTYTVTVTCEETSALTGVKVQLKKGDSVAGEKELTDGKAEFVLEEDTYTATLTNVPDGYSFEGATLTKDAPAATITLVKESVTPEPQKVTYTVTVSCEETSALTGVKVQLKKDGAVADEKELTGGKAEFVLDEGTYTATLTNVPEGYTFEDVTLTKDAPAATITLVKESVTPEPQKVTYTVTVSCEETSALTGVKVRLKKGDAVKDEKELTGGKAEFVLDEDTYTATLTNVPDGYTFEDVTLTKDAPAATITLVKEQVTPEPIAYSVTVKYGASENVFGAKEAERAAEGVTVELYVQVTDQAPAASAETNASGVATFSLTGTSYTVVLKNVAPAYEVQTASLTESNKSVTITLQPKEILGTQNAPITWNLGVNNVPMTKELLEDEDAYVYFSFTAEKSGVYSFDSNNDNALVLSDVLPGGELIGKTHHAEATLEAGETYLFKCAAAGSDGDNLGYTITITEGSTEVEKPDIPWTGEGTEEEPYVLEKLADDYTVLIDYDAVTGKYGNVYFSYTSAADQNYTVTSTDENFFLTIYRLEGEDKVLVGNYSYNPVGALFAAEANAKYLLVLSAEAETDADVKVSFSVTEGYTGYIPAWEGKGTSSDPYIITSITGDYVLKTSIGGMYFKYDATESKDYTLTLTDLSVPESAFGGNITQISFSVRKGTFNNKDDRVTFVLSLDENKDKGGFSLESGVYFLYVSPVADMVEPIEITLKFTIEEGKFQGGGGGEVGPGPVGSQTNPEPMSELLGEHSVETTYDPGYWYVYTAPEDMTVSVTVTTPGSLTINGKSCQTTSAKTPKTIEVALKAGPVLIHVQAGGGASGTVKFTVVKTVNKVQYTATITKGDLDVFGRGCNESFLPAGTTVTLYLNGEPVMDGETAVTALTTSKGTVTFDAEEKDGYSFRVKGYDDEFFFTEKTVKAVLPSGVVLGKTADAPIPWTLGENEVPFTRELLEKLSGEGVEYVFFSFTPEKTSVYTFSTTQDAIVQAVLDGIFPDMLGGTVGTKYFTLKELTEGTAYVFKASSSSGNGYSVTIEEGNTTGGGDVEEPDYPWTEGDGSFDSPFIITKLDDTYEILVKYLGNGDYQKVYLAYTAGDADEYYIATALSNDYAISFGTVNLSSAPMASKTMKITVKANARLFITVGEFDESEKHVTVNFKIEVDPDGGKVEPPKEGETPETAKVLESFEGAHTYSAPPTYYIKYTETVTTDYTITAGQNGVALTVRDASAPDKIISSMSLHLRENTQGGITLEGGKTYIFGTSPEIDGELAGAVSFSFSVAKGKFAGNPDGSENHPYPLESIEGEHELATNASGVCYSFTCTQSGKYRFTALSSIYLSFKKGTTKSLAGAANKTVDVDLQEGTEYVISVMPYGGATADTVKFKVELLAQLTTYTVNVSSADTDVFGRTINQKPKAIKVSLMLDGKSVTAIMSSNQGVAIFNVEEKNYTVEVDGKSYSFDESHTANVVILSADVYGADEEHPIPLQLGDNPLPFTQDVIDNNQSGVLFVFKPEKSGNYTFTGSNNNCYLMLISGGSGFGYGFGLNGSMNQLTATAKLEAGTEYLIMMMSLNTEAGKTDWTLTIEKEEEPEPTEYTVTVTEKVTDVFGASHSEGAKAGVEVELYDGDSFVEKQTTGADGKVTFTQLPKAYTVKIGGVSYNFENKACNVVLKTVLGDEEHPLEWVVGTNTVEFSKLLAEYVGTGYYVTITPETSGDYSFKADSELAEIFFLDESLGFIVGTEPVKATLTGGKAYVLLLSLMDESAKQDYHVTIGEWKGSGTSADPEILDVLDQTLTRTVGKDKSSAYYFRIQAEESCVVTISVNKVCSIGGKLVNNSTTSVAANGKLSAKVESGSAVDFFLWSSQGEVTITLSSSPAPAVSWQGAGKKSDPYVIEDIEDDFDLFIPASGEIFFSYQASEDMTLVFTPKTTAYFYLYSGYVGNWVQSKTKGYNSAKFTSDSVKITGGSTFLFSVKYSSQMSTPAALVSFNIAKEVIAEEYTVTVNSADKDVYGNKLNAAPKADVEVHLYDGERLVETKTTGTDGKVTFTQPHKDYTVKIGEETFSFEGNVLTAEVLSGVVYGTEEHPLTLEVGTNNLPLTEDVMEQYDEGIFYTFTAPKSANYHLSAPVGIMVMCMELQLSNFEGALDKVVSLTKDTAYTFIISGGSASSLTIEEQGGESEDYTVTLYGELKDVFGRATTSPLANVTVALYDGEELVTSGKTGEDGSVVLTAAAKSYTLKLSALPEGYTSGDVAFSGEEKETSLTLTSSVVLGLAEDEDGEVYVPMVWTEGVNDLPFTVELMEDLAAKELNGFFYASFTPAADGNYVFTLSNSNGTVESVTDPNWKINPTGGVLAVSTIDGIVLTKTYEGMKAGTAYIFGFSTTGYEAETLGSIAYTITIAAATDTKVYYTVTVKEADADVYGNELNAAPKAGVSVSLYKGEELVETLTTGASGSVSFHAEEYDGYTVKVNEKSYALSELTDGTVVLQTGVVYGTSAHPLTLEVGANSLPLTEEVMEKYSSAVYYTFTAPKSASYRFNIPAFEGMISCQGLGITGEGQAIDKVVACTKDKQYTFTIAGASTLSITIEEVVSTVTPDSGAGTESDPYVCNNPYGEYEVEIASGAKYYRFTATGSDLVLNITLKTSARVSVTGGTFSDGKSSWFCAGSVASTSQKTLTVKAGTSVVLRIAAYSGGSAPVKLVIENPAAAFAPTQYALLPEEQK